MDVARIIGLLGGTKAVMGITGLSRARISQWRSANYIPRPWLLLFRERRPDIFGPPPDTPVDAPPAGPLPNTEPAREEAA